MPPWQPVTHDSDQPMPSAPSPLPRPSSSSRSTAPASSKRSQDHVLTPPLSPPGSPETRTDRTGGMELPERDDEEREHSRRLRSRRARTADGASQGSDDGGEGAYEAYEQRNGRTSRPSRVSFPTSTPSSDDDEQWVPQPKPSTSALRSDRKRCLSQTTTTTTTTTQRKTERRRVRYSLPDLEHLFDENFPPVRPSPHHRSSSSSSTSKLSSAFLANRSHSPSPGPSRARSPSGKVRRTSSSRSRRRSSLYDDTPPKHSASSNWDWNSPGPRNAGPASSSPFFARSFGGGNGLALQRRNSSQTDDDASDEVSAFATALTETTMPFVRPVVSAFAFLAVWAVAALTVSAVLLASFSLTFYDDCAQRLGSVHRSLGGVRAGMGRLIGNARGALDLAVRAAGSINVSGEPDGLGGAGAHGRKRRTAMPTVQEEDANEEGDVDGFFRSKRSRTTKEPHSRTSSNTSGSSSGSASPRATFASPLRPFTSFSGADERTTEAGWGTDEDALPYDVPHPTPSTSRPASPHRQPRSRTPSGTALPPRPPLAVLIPSVILALLFTLVKLVAGAVKGQKAAVSAH
ncbi:hypothetical protein JCM10207_006433 [Rhodosporidiobolus poonsookiae]